MRFFKLFESRTPWDDFDYEPGGGGGRRSKNPFNFDDIGFNFNFDGPKILLIVCALLLVWLASGLYKVKEGERAVVLRFGKYHATAFPGLNYHLPFPFESVIVENVDNSRRVEIGYRSASTSRGRTSSKLTFVSSENTMLTGDQNIVFITCDVMWHIKSLQNYVFNVIAPEEAVRAVSQSALREVVGNIPISSVLSDKKEQIADDVEKLIQKTLDNYNIGVEVENVQLLKAEPPSEVIDSYRDVQTARADKERKINQAQAYNNDILPRARGEAAKITERAKGYKQERIAKAEGDAKRFLALYKEYLSNKQVTKDRIYLETMEGVLSGRDKVVMGKGAILPHMNVKSE